MPALCLVNDLLTTLVGDISNSATPITLADAIPSANSPIIYVNPIQISVCP